MCPASVALVEADLLRWSELRCCGAVRRVPMADNAFVEEINTRAFSDPDDVAILKTQYHEMVEE